MKIPTLKSEAGIDSKESIPPDYVAAAGVGMKIPVTVP
jgi:hypothetical protein